MAECDELVADLGLMVQPLNQGSIAESQLLMMLPQLLFSLIHIILTVSQDITMIG